MKLIIIALMAACCMAGGQTYHDRPPKAVEQRKIAGLTHWPQDAPPANWSVVTSSADNSTVTLTIGQTNNVILRNPESTNRNVFVFLPSPTNAQGARFQIVSSGLVVGILTNASVLSFHDTTNSVAALTSGWTMRTNTAVQVFTTTGTNWFVLPVKS